MRTLTPLATRALCAAALFASAPASKADVPLRNIVEIATGTVHTCARTSEGAVWCWGNNQGFQLGLPAGSPSQVFATRLPTITTGAIAIDVGNSHGCAVMADGGLRCWGLSDLGQVGAGAPLIEYEPATVYPAGSQVAAVATGSGHTCAIVGAARQVQCWGWNEFLQLGDGTTTNRRTPVPVIGLGSGILAIAAGLDHSCALEPAGSLRCWGTNASGQLGDGSFDSRALPTPVLGLPGPATAIAAGDNATCARLASGSLYCWGTPFTLGTGAVAPANLPQSVAALGDSVAGISLAPGSALACAWTHPGAALCWGIGGSGQLGVGGFPNSSALPQGVFWLTNGIVRMDAGGLHACAVRANGVAQCWGLNTDGQLAAGTSAVRPRPVPALLTPDTSSTGGRKIAAGPQHGCAIDSGGAVHCWGLNSNGELGNGSNAPATEPAPVSGISSGASAVAAGGRHSCAVVTGQVRCWGSNTVGQLGNNDTASSNSPVTVSGINNAVAVAAGSSHNCALTTTGGVLCWGANGRGQLGNNSTTLSRVPVAVVGLGSGVAELALGFSHSCARLTSGALRCWGANSEGQLGSGESGSNVDQSVPNGVSGFGATSAATSAIALGAGDRHTCAVRPSGDLLCWGANGQGQVGDGSGLPRRTTPVLVGGPLPQGWSGVDGGSTHTCAYRTSPARLACWGINPLGELGTGSVGTGSNVPVAVALAFSAFNLPVALSLGANHSCAQLDPALPGAAQLLCWGNDQFGQIGDGGRGYDTPGLVLSDFEVFADGFD